MTQQTQQPSSERRVWPRASMRVIHRHRIGAQTLQRVSELVFIRGEPKVVLEWLDMAGVRAPIYLTLDPDRLHAPVRPARQFYRYDGVTSDPRFDLE